MALVVAALGCGDGALDLPDGAVGADGGADADAAPAGGASVDFWVTRAGPTRVPLAALSAPWELANLRVRTGDTKLPIELVAMPGEPAVFVHVPDLTVDGHSRELHLIADFAPDDPSPAIAERDMPPTRDPPRVGRILQRRTAVERSFWAYAHPADPGQGFPDCWVGTAIRPGESAQPVFASFPASARASELEVTLSGGAVFEHLVDVSVGGQDVGEIRFAGADTVTASFDVDELAPDAEGNYDVSLTLSSANVGDKVHLRSATLVAKSELSFAGLPIHLDGLEATTVDLLLPAASPDPLIAWEVTDPFAPRLITLSSHEGRLLLPRFEPGRKYLVFDPASLPAPADFITFDEAAQSERILDDSGDLLVIAPTIFHAALAPWLAARAAAGWTPILSTPRQLYQTFTAGRPTPDAISAYLEHALSSWDVPPRALLLVGDATPEIDPMPEFAVPTNYLWLPGNKWIPSDLVYALPTWAEPGGPAPPLFAVGRIPARTSAEVAAAISRSLAHSASADNHMLFLSDDNDASFRAAAELVRAELSADFVSAALHLLDYNADYPNPEPPPPQWEEPAIIAMRADLSQALADGARMVQYFGHGDLNHVAGEGLLAQRSDLYNLEELLGHGGTPPVFVLHSCLAGYFALPSLPHTIAESMMLLADPALGAAAVISPSAYADTSFSGDFAPRLGTALARPNATLGEALITSAHEFLRDSYCAVIDCRVLMMSMSLLGDPTLPAL